MEEKRRPWDEFEMNMRLVILEYILEVGSIEKIAESLYESLKDEEADDWYAHRVLQKARDAGYLPSDE